MPTNTGNAQPGNMPHEIVAEAAHIHAFICSRLACIANYTAVGRASRAVQDHRECSCSRLYLSEALASYEDAMTTSIVNRKHTNSLGEAAVWVRTES